MRIDDRLLAAIFIVAAVTIGVVASGFPRLAGMTVGPGLFPIVLSAALAGASLLLAVGAKAAGDDHSAKLVTLPAELADRRVWWRVLAVFGSCLLFALLGQRLGFVIVGILSLLWLLLAFGTSVCRAAMIAVVTVVIIDLFLVRVMRIPLPLGLLHAFGGVF